MSTRLTDRTERLDAMELMLFRSPTGLRAVELAEACGVDRRTVYRDLSLLRDFGIPLYQKEGRFYIDRDRYVATVRLSYDEALALLLGASALSQSPVHNPHFSTAITKLSQALPNPVALHAAYISELAKLPPPGAVSGEILTCLAQAWGEQQRVKVWYSNRDGSKTRAREVCIYFIEPKLSGTHYMVGLDVEMKRIRAFKLNRVKRVELLSTPYQTPPHFDPRRYLNRVRGDDGTT